MSSIILPAAWYALHTRSRFEKVVNDGLLKKSIDVFLPRITVVSRRKDRKKMIRVPLFPGYLFVKSDLSAKHHLAIVKTVGAVELLATKSGPVPVPDQDIDSLRIMAASDQTVSTGRQFERGDRVMVIKGPFVGVEGIFERYGKGGRVVVHIDALGQFAAVEVDIAQVEQMQP